jgi:glycosyltransferase involved in cell wall biosynthesis
MTIRVLEIIPTLVRGGAEKQMTLLATRLPPQEFDVHVAVLTHSGPYEETLASHNIPTNFIEKRWKLDPPAYWKLRKVIRNLRPDLVHTWIFAANCYGRQAAISVGVPRIIAGERCVDRWKVWHELAIDRYLARRTNCIAVNSTGVRDFYTQHGLPEDKFAVIPNGIEPTPNGAAVSREELAEKLDIPPEAYWIGAIGRLWPQKRYKDLIWSAELLRAAAQDTHLLIFGDGPQRDRLEQYANQVGVSQRVHFLGTREDVAAWLSHFDCFWLGSGYEGQSNALMEAMLAGVPCVATDIPGNRDLVIPEQTGYLVPVGDSAAFARQTMVLRQDRDLARSMGQRARARMLEEFTVDKMVERYAELYRRVCDRRES